MRRLRNLTITVEETVAHWARLRAAHENKSVSRLVGDMLKQSMTAEEGYQAAMEDYLARKPYLRVGRALPSRDQLHELEAPRR